MTCTLCHTLSNNYLDRHIRLLCLSPHSAHKFQSLDMGVFSSLQAYYSDAVNNWIYEPNTRGRDKLRKAEFLHLYIQACTRAFTTECIKQAFKSTGICPINGQKWHSPPLADSDSNTVMVTNTPHRKQDTVALELRLKKQQYIND